MVDTHLICWSFLFLFLVAASFVISFVQYVFYLQNVDSIGNLFSMSTSAQLLTWTMPYGEQECRVSQLVPRHVRE